MRRTLALAALVAACTFVSVVTPTSESASVGTSAPYTVYVECGLRHSVFDLDGSLWVPTGVTNEDVTTTPSGFLAPDDTGILSLVAPDKAQYRSSQGRVIELVRHAGNLEIPSGCG
jgi:hypothetical protein